MKATYLGKEKEVWIVSQNSDRPDWVDYGFTANYIHWTSESEEQVVADVRGLMITNIGKKYVNSKGKGYGVFFGKLGDVINLTDGTIVSARKFEQSYEIIESHKTALLSEKIPNHLTDRQSEYWLVLTSLIEEGQLSFDERRPLFLAYNSINSGQNFGDVMRKLVTDLENVKISQKGELSPKLTEIFIGIKKDHVC